MTLATILLFAEGDADGPSGLTLELAAKARTLADTVNAFVPVYGEAMAAELGAHGVSTVYALEGLGERLVGVHAAAALAAHVEATAPDAVFFGQTADGRDTAGRLAVLLDRPAVTNNVGAEVSDGVLVVEEPIFGGTQNMFTAYRAPAPALALFRPKSFEAQACGGDAASVETVSAVDPGDAGRAVITGRHSEQRSGPQLDDAAVVVSGGRGLGQPEAYSMVDELAGLLGRRFWCLTRDSRCRLGALRQAGRADRQGREAERLYRLRHLRRHAASRGHEGLQEHRGHQQRP